MLNDLLARKMNAWERRLNIALISAVFSIGFGCGLLFHTIGWALLIMAGGFAALFSVIVVMYLEYGGKNDPEVTQDDSTGVRSERKL